MLRPSPKTLGLVLSIFACASEATAAERASPADAPASWWAFQPLTSPPLPNVEDDSWVRTPIDRFVLQKLRENDMRPAQTADRLTLVRRLYYDLIGLPPSPEEIQAFLDDRRENAWESLVDRLLADPRYGEHWARYWLDVVRYAESDGWKADAYRPHIWRYRGFVVRAFNQDTPYDRFVRMQLAGDEMPGDEPENLIATGFLRLGIYEYNQRDAKNHWDDIIHELTDVTADVFLGVSMACARCHDHKFDPLPQRDYFGLKAFFEPLAWRDDLTATTYDEREDYAKQLAAWNEATAELRGQSDALLKPYRDRKWQATVDKFPLDIQACYRKPVAERTSWEQQMAYLVERQFYEEGNSPLQNMKKDDRAKYDHLQEDLAEFDHLKPEPPPGVMSVSDFVGNISATRIPGSTTEVQPTFLTALQRITHEGPPSFSELREGGAAQGGSGRRTALAQWIGQPDNPLTTRVIVNRIWQQHFGQGIVPSASDFGRMGQPPSHPELLDWLAITFAQNGWSTKSLHRLIVTSATWQQSAHHERAEEYEAIDPTESLLWRARVRRLTAEQIRDSMLAASGDLDLTLGGPSVEGDSRRRSLYLKSFRNTPHEFLHAFDMANGLKSVAERPTTTTPTQSLLMFNGQFVLDRARRLAHRLQPLSAENYPEALTNAFLLTWGRQPTASERQVAEVYHGNLAGGATSQALLERIEDVCHVLLNSNEFLYID